ncbi:hypothetical protein [Streptomyces ficellus]|uniref:Uncharacterized protein n=1 Tax=Streptomyces ficellus TaxID=1977088 RepID=A0A6I6FVK5_9ACTN|nr:hypothetical protein [Streptomyces ficellus]QGV82018.1 hypothetical protein EIZ62_29990 [Streptomyces ficellus]
MTTPETRHRLEEIEHRLAGPTPSPIEGQTRIPLTRPAPADEEEDGAPTPRPAARPPRPGTTRPTT